MNVAIALPVLLSMAFGGAFVVNEWSHGGVSEAMGLGHHHMLDYAQMHCSHAAMHMDANATYLDPHSRCAGSGMGNRSRMMM